jgi:hypothetical protein
MSDLATEFSGHTNIDWQGNVGVARYGKEPVVIFYNRSVHNRAKSIEAGRIVNEDQVFVKIYQPGEERYNIVDKPATQDVVRQWPRQWAAYQQNKTHVPDGTPVDLLYPEQPSVGATLRAHGVHTMEQLVELSGTAIDNIGMGCQKWLNDAARYLSVANKGVGLAQMRKELEGRDAEIRTLNHKVELLTAEMERMRAQGATQGGISPEQLLAAVQTLTGRPVLPGPPSMPGPEHSRAAPYDAATAQINALAPTAEAARQRNKTKAKKPELHGRKFAPA